MKLRMLGVTALALFAAGVPVPARAEAFTVEGRVESADGAGVPRVVVHAIGHEEGAPKRITVTDEAGRFFFEEVPEGDYTIVVRRAGEVVHSAPLELAGDVDDIRVVLDDPRESARLFPAHAVSEVPSSPARRRRPRAARRDRPAW